MKRLALALSLCASVAWAGGTSSNFGAAFPAAGTAAGAKSQSGSTMQPLNEDNSGNLYVDPWGPLTSTGFVAVAAFTVATSISAPAGSFVCFIQAETNNVRFRTDGTAPTASTGQLLPKGTMLTETLPSLSTIQFIPTTGSANLDVDCYK